MLSVFKKKPKFNNEANQDLSRMLFYNPDDPVQDYVFFENKPMDFTVDSLEILGEYLESLRTDLPEKEARGQVLLFAMISCRNSVMHSRILNEAKGKRQDLPPAADPLLR